MRILYHHRTRAGDAQGVHIDEIVRAFRELGHDVRVVALAGRDGGGDMPRVGASRLLKRAPAWLYELMSLGYNVYGYRRLCRERREFRPDLVYERYSLNTFCGVWAARRHHVPLVLEVNAPLAYEQMELKHLAFRKLARFSERWICSHSTGTIVVTGIMKDILAAEGVPREHMVVVTNGVDPSRFHPAVSGAEVRRKYGLEGRLVVGFVGWFREWHGIKTLLDVTLRARLEDLGARILLVGDGPRGPVLRRFVEELGLEGSVVFTGPVGHDEVPAHIAAMDVTVIPRAPEYACPMKIVEYMAMAKCVVAPDQPNIREILENGRNGRLFAPENPDAFASALLEVVRDRPMRESLGKAALENVHSKKYLWRTNAERAIALAGMAKPITDPARPALVLPVGPVAPETEASVTPNVPDPSGTTVGGTSHAHVEAGGR